MANQPRVGIFIDGPNLYGGARDLTGDGRLDIPAFVQWVASGRSIEEAVFWTAQLKQSVDATKYAGQQRFFADIANRIPNARVGRAHLVRRQGRWVEKGVDVGVALDLVAGAFEDRWDVGIAVTAQCLVRTLAESNLYSHHRLVEALERGVTRRREVERLAQWLVICCPSNKHLCALLLPPRSKASSRLLEQLVKSRLEHRLNAALQSVARRPERPLLAQNHRQCPANGGFSVRALRREVPGRQELYFRANIHLPENGQ